MIRFKELDNFLQERGFTYVFAKDGYHTDDRYVWVKGPYKVNYYWHNSTANIIYEFVGSEDPELMAAGVLSFRIGSTLHMSMPDAFDKRWVGSQELTLELIDSNLRDCRFYKKQDAKDYLGVFL